MFPTAAQLGCLLCESGTVNLRLGFSEITREFQSSRRVLVDIAVGTWRSFHCGRPVRPRQRLAAIPRPSKYSDCVIAEFSNIIKSQQPIVLQYLRKDLLAYRIFNIKGRDFFFVSRRDTKICIEEKETYLLSFDSRYRILR